MKTCWYLIALMPTGATPNERQNAVGTPATRCCVILATTGGRAGRSLHGNTCKVSGFKQPIDDAEWTITTLTHTVSPDNGFTTSLELEVRIDDFEME